ncbi:MAG: CDP-glycerol glycerophosphotransferase family protein [bacterium]|nr:CDP-glycerol glycerophosphotransferase family protein [bacterium]
MEKAKKKTIAISSFHTLISRNILRSGLLEELQGRVNIVIFCPQHKKDFFKNEFAGEHVSVVGVPGVSLSRRERVARTIGAALLPTSTIQFKKKAKYWRDKKRIHYIFSLALLSTIARLKHTPILFRRLFSSLYDQDIFGAFFQAYQPDLVFSTDVLDWNDVRMLKEAKAHGIKTVGMVRSWDNLSNKSLVPVAADSFLVNNDFTKKELVEFHNIRFKDITVVGMPQFDYYIGYQPTGRKKFFEKLGFDPGRNIIMFAPMGNKFIETDWQMLQLLHDKIYVGDIHGSPQILVRFPPGDDFRRDQLRLSDRVNIYFDKPGTAFQSEKRKDNELGREDMIHLADSLFYSDVLVNAGSSLCIDIAAFDRPIIYPEFDGGTDAPYFRSVRHFPEYHHYKHLVMNNACKNVSSPEELVVWVNRYVADPSLHREERRALVRAHCSKHDGKAHTRIASVLLQMLENGFSAAPSSVLYSNKQYD